MITVAEYLRKIEPITIKNGQRKVIPDEKRWLAYFAARDVLTTTGVGALPYADIVALVTTKAAKHNANFTRVWRLVRQWRTQPEGEQLPLPLG
jgi:hypothetical protein